MSAAPFLATEAELDVARRHYAEHGFVVLGAPWLAPPLFDALRAEAQQARTAAWDCHKPGSADTPAQRNRRAELGVLGRLWLESPALARLLAVATGHRARASWEASCYTYYEGAPDFLAPHLDREQSCALTVLVYLDRAGTGPGTSLAFYPSLDAHAAPWLRVGSVENRGVILRGALLPHGREPLTDGERVTALSACFALDEGPAHEY